MLFIIYGATFHRLWEQRKKDVRNWFFIGYINVMFVLGTLYMITEAWSTQVGFVDYPGGPLQFGAVSDGYPLEYMGNVVFILADWLADGLLVSLICVLQEPIPSSRYIALEMPSNMARQSLATVGHRPLSIIPLQYW